MMSEEKATEPFKIFCRYVNFYWSAKCSVGNRHFETQKTTHGSARQAADEIVVLVSKLTGVQNIPMRRLYPKIYEIVVPNVESPRIECDVLFGVCVMAWSRGQLVFKMHSSESAIRRLGRCKDKHRMEAEERLRSAKQPFDSIRVRFYSSPNSQAHSPT